MSTGDALLTDILAAPGDDTPRLIYADWLEEHGGDPARAEFIRVQCELARLYAGDLSAVTAAKTVRGLELRQREQGLLARKTEKPIGWPLWRDWVPPIIYNAIPSGHGTLIHDHLTFRRGFVSSVSLPTQSWLAHGPDIVRACPLWPPEEAVRLTDKTPHWTGQQWAWLLSLGYDVTEFAWRLPECLPEGLFAALDGFDGDPASDVGVRYYHDAGRREPHAALQALCRACLAWARRAPQAALPVTPSAGPR